MQTPLSQNVMLSFKKIVLLFFLCFCASSFAVDKIEIGERHTLTSSILSEELRVSVYLPRTYSTNNQAKYDVLYILDGGTNLLHAAGSQYFLAGYRQMPELVIVGIHSNNRNRDLTPTQVDSVPSSGGASKFRQYIKTELIPFVEKTYRTSSKRYLSGHSYGGLFAIDTMVKALATGNVQAELSTQDDKSTENNITHDGASAALTFDAYFTFSPSLRWDNNVVLSSALKMLNDERLHGYLYVCIGDEGINLKRPILELHEGLKAMDNSKLKWKVDWLENENHSTTSVIGQFLAYRDYFEL